MPQFLLPGLAHAKIRLPVDKRPHLVGDLPVQLGDGAARHGQHLGQQGCGVDAVLAGDVPLDGQAPGALAADDGVRLGHLGGDPLEAHGHLIALLPQAFRHPVQQMGGGIVAHAGALPAAIFDQVVIEQHQQGVGVDEAALLVDDAQAVRIAVGGHAQIAVPVRHHIGEGGQGLGVGGRELAAEEGVMPVMDDLQIAAAGGQDGAQAGLAHPVHGVQGDLQPRFFDGLHIHQREDAVNVIVGGVILHHQTLAQRLLIVEAGDRRLVHQGALGLDPVRDAPVRVPAAGGEDLHAVVDGRVVACRDHHAVGHVPGLDGVHDEGRGRGAVDHQHPVAIAHQHLRDPVGRLLGQKTPVIAHAELSARVALFVHQAAEPRRQQAEIGLGEFIGDNGAPAAGSEMDHLSRSFPMTTSTRQTLPAGRHGTMATSRPSAVRERRPFSTPSGFITWIS